jgi:CBS domain containing-hemolysin-like protein
VNQAWPIIMPWLPACMVLLALSAFFSGSEAVLLSLTANDRRKLADGGSGARAAARLLGRPDQLLATILLSNLLVNMLLFSGSSILGRSLAAELGTGAGLAVAATTLGLVILFGELLPKSLGALNPQRFAPWVGLPLLLLTRFLRPLFPILDGINRLVGNLLAPNLGLEPELSIDDIERAIELGTDDAQFAELERSVLRHAVQLSEVRADEWMRPRGSYRLHAWPVTWEQLESPLPSDGLILLAEHDGEDVEQSISLRRLRPSQLLNLAESVEPVLVVPWSAPVAEVLDRLRSADRQVAAVVNEYGDTIGILAQDDIVDGLIQGEPSRATPRGRASLENVRPNVYRVSGLMSARRLSNLLSIPLPTGRNVTVAGLIQEQNRRLARVGDRAQFGEWEFEVVQAPRRGHWIVELRRAGDTTDAEAAE